MKQKTTYKTIIRVCAGCTIPINSNLIGTGKYFLTIQGIKREEQFYDYEILDTELLDFIMMNKDLLLKYQLLDNDIVLEESDDTEKPS